MRHHRSHRVILPLHLGVPAMTISLLLAAATVGSLFSSPASPAPVCQQVQCVYYQAEPNVDDPVARCLGNHGFSAVQRGRYLAPDREIAGCAHHSDRWIARSV